MSGERVLRVTRSLVWPSLRVPPNDTHSSLIHRYGPEAEPAITVAGAPLGDLRVTRVVLDGTLTFHATAAAGLEIARCTFPTTARAPPSTAGRCATPAPHRSPSRWRRWRSTMKRAGRTA